MSDLPPDLYRLEVLEYYLQQQLTAVRARIADLKAVEERRHLGGQPPPQGVRDPSLGPPTTDEVKWWRLQPGRTERGVLIERGVLHGGSCADYPGGRLPDGWGMLTRPEARAALAEESVRPCEKCRPQVGLK